MKFCETLERSQSKLSPAPPSYTSLPAPSLIHLPPIIQVLSAWVQCNPDFVYFVDESEMEDRGE